MDTIPPMAKAGDPILAADWNAMTAATRGSRVIPGANTPGRQGSEGFVFDRPADAPGIRPYQTWLPMPFGMLWENGVWIDGMDVTIFNPTARRFGDPQGSSPDYTCADATITIGGNGAGQRIIWQWSPDAGLSIQTNAQTNDPTDSPPIIRGVLAIFDVTNNLPWFAKGGAKSLGRHILLPVFTKGTS